MDTSSIAQEYYKLRDMWSAAEKDQSWKLAVWVAQYADVEIIDKFMQIEQSPVGETNDIFFRFETEYKGDRQVFEQQLWNEFLTWFTPHPDKEKDLHRALWENNMIRGQFIPDSQLPPDAASLFSELERLKMSITDQLGQFYFCLYFPLSVQTQQNIAHWFQQVIETLPDSLRLVTMDLAEERRIELQGKKNGESLYHYLKPKLKMAEAIKNEMYKSSDNYNTVDPDARFRKQVIVVMDSTTKKVQNRTDTEVKRLLDITKEIGTVSSKIAGLLVASQAYFSVQNTKKSEEYTDKALEESSKAMAEDDATGYPVWKSCMLLKAALLYGNKNRDAALLIYQDLSEKASQRQDVYYIMEANRLIAHIYYEKNNLQKAFENVLFSLAAGAYLEISVRRQSTFLHAAFMALYLGKQIKTADEVNEIKLQLADWLGDDWEVLLAQAGVDSASLKMEQSVWKEQLSKLKN
ncbi:tetratricopeptide repeat protein [Chryseobacterium kwangjuense]|uniref:Uncharacterized protein n=1 Tax=Chryseobacterium kwangjuense TaxID=267125 RepID=A0A135W8F5_9FLAO|nr:hypothetical protein [Chryseobacterium kwangjuense]KXH81203.1 hypothetical protein AU378_15925 [Chryseobacterium kwangjuense]